MTEMALTSSHYGGTGTSAPTSAANNTSGFLDSEFRYVLLPVAYGIIFVLGVFTNVYVLVVLHCLRGTRSMGEIRIYMTNLTVADLLFVSALPFWIVYYSRGGNWMFTDAMCRLTGSFFFINTYCSILFLAAISVNRYWAVTRPLDAASSDHRRRGVVVSVVIWALTVAMAVPSLASSASNIHQDGLTRCFEGYHLGTDTQKRVLVATHFAIIAGFFVIFFLVVVCNALIARALLCQSPPESGVRSAKLKSRLSKRPRGVRRRALRMLLAVVGVFALCFLPHHLVQGPWTLAVLRISKGWGHVDWDQGTLQALNDAHQITLLLMGLNCILDPVIYFFSTGKFRRFIMGQIKNVVKGEGCSAVATTQLSMDAKNQSQVAPTEHQLKRLQT